MSDPPQHPPGGRRFPAFHNAREKLTSLSWQWQCPSSPSGAHYWRLDQGDYGVCRHCGEERQFGPEKEHTASE